MEERQSRLSSMVWRRLRPYFCVRLILLNSMFSNFCHVLKPEGYFDEDLRVTNSLSRLYITALWYLYIYNYTEDIYNNFDLVYNHIINDFEGDERAYLMSAMIGLFASKNSTSYSEQLLNAIEKASQYTQNEVCLRYIEKAKMFYTLLDRQILENILENTYLR